VPTPSNVRSADTRDFTFRARFLQRLLTQGDEARILEQVASKIVLFVFWEPRDFQPMIQATLMAGVKGKQARLGFGLWQFR
jgi:hypothetical protein